jgi:hypothetical protein
MTASSTVLLVLATSALSAFAGVQQFQRRASLARLRTVLGVQVDGYAPGFAHALEWVGAKIPGGSDGSLQLTLAKAGYFQPSALHIFVALRFVCTVAVFCAVLLQASVIGATTLALAVFLAFFGSRTFVIAIKFKAGQRERLLRRELRRSSMS